MTVSCPIPRHPTGRALVVDDSETNRRLLAALLAADGQTATTVGGGAEALQVMATDAFDVILLDLMMPDMDGFATLAAIRADGRWAETPVVVVSALHDEASLVRAIDAGADDYLTKPIQATVLRARVRASVDRSQTRALQRRLMAELQAERDRAERLLHNILPPAIARRLQASNATIADNVAAATVVFVDVVGFTPMAAHASPEAMVACLNALFGEYDRLALYLGIEKIKTIGDAYMAVAGVPEPREDHAAVAVRFAQAACTAASRLRGPDGAPLHVRAGVHCGPLVAGVVGSHKYAYDVWGDVVNTAARLQSAAQPDRVLLSDDVRKALRGRPWHISDSFECDLKGKGRVSAAYLLPEA